MAHKLYAPVQLVFLNNTLSYITLVARELNPYVESRFEQYRNVSTCAGHINRVWDIALMISDKPININENVKPAALPPTKDVNATGEVWIAGWCIEGKFEWGGPPKMTDTLRKIKMEVISDEECNRSYDGIIEVAPEQICTELINVEEEGMRTTCLADI